MRTIRNVIGVLFVAALWLHNEQQVRAEWWVEQLGISAIQCDEDGPQCFGYYTRILNCRFDNSGVDYAFPDWYWTEQECEYEHEIEGYGYIESFHDDARDICYMWDPFAHEDDYNCQGGGGGMEAPVYGTFTCVWNEQTPCSM